MELADIFRQYGPAYRQAHSLPLHQHRLMQAIETCRTPLLGGTVEWCGHCQFTHIRYRSCRNRHCPKCQGAAREHWLEDRRAELLPTEYFHVVFTLPEQIASLAFYNKEVVYGILFHATAETLLTTAAQRLGVELGFFCVLHSWGQNLFFGDLDPLRDPGAFDRFLAPLQHKDWVVYAKPPFGGPAHVLEYLGRYTHRVAISNHRLLALQDGQVCFSWTDYRDSLRKVMTVPAEEFIRLFLQHALPPGFQRIRYYGFLANCHRADKLALCRNLLATPDADLLPSPTDYPNPCARLRLCPKCRIGTMVQLQVLFPCYGPVPMLVDTS